VKPTFPYRVECKRKGDRSPNAWRHLATCRTLAEAQAAIDMRQSSDDYLAYEFRIKER
jgi:hypothetical protein